MSLGMVNLRGTCTGFMTCGWTKSWTVQKPWNGSISQPRCQQTLWFPPWLYFVVRRGSVHQCGRFKSSCLGKTRIKEPLEKDFHLASPPGGLHLRDGGPAFFPLPSTSGAPSPELGQSWRRDLGGCVVVGLMLNYLGLLYYIMGVHLTQLGSKYHGFIQQYA